MRAHSLLRACAVLALASIASSALVSTTAILTPFEVGAATGTTPVSGALGVSSVVVDTTAMTVTVQTTLFGIPAVAASHIHSGAVGVGGGVIVPLGTSVSANAQTISADTMNAILNGTAYVNVHTAAYGGGEIRGQARWAGALAGARSAI